MEKENPQSEYQKFITDKHERLFNTPEHIIQDVVKKVDPSEIVSRERIIKGEANEVYLVKTSSGKELIVRISHGEEPRFESEKWAIDACREVGVPAPKVLLIENLKNDEKQLAVNVQEKLPGIPLNEIEDLDVGQKNSCLQQAGLLLSKIHSLSVSGYGGTDSEGRGKYDSIKEVVSSLCLKEVEIKRIGSEKGFDLDSIDQAFQLLKEGAESYGNMPPSLLHNDYGPKHLLVDQGVVTGVIDFENAEGGDPVKEFARWDFFFGEKYPYQELVKGYENKKVFEESFPERFKIWKIYLGLSHISYYYKENNKGGLDLSFKNLIKDLNS